MYTELLQGAPFFEFLFQCDRDLAERARSEGCAWCQGKLHQANYPRKPRGAPSALPPDFSIRLSSCCATEECRRRCTPPSLRFLGRRVYLAAVVVLAAAMQQGPTPTRARQLQELIGVSPRTLARWRTWWQSIFPRSSFWKASRGTFGLPIAATDLPRALLDRFDGDLSTRLHSFLKFLAPLSTASVFSAGFLMAAVDPQKMRAAVVKTSR